MKEMAILGWRIEGCIAFVCLFKRERERQFCVLIGNDYDFVTKELQGMVLRNFVHLRQMVGQRKTLNL